MPTSQLTIVLDYLNATLRGIREQRLKDGRLRLSVDQFPHLTAEGDNYSEAVGELVTKLLSVVFYRAEHHYALPVLEGIYLNSEEGKKLMEYHQFTGFPARVVPLVLTEENGRFTVESPALPELLTEGDNLDDALENARDALTAVFEMYEDLGKPLPADISPDSGPMIFDVPPNVASFA